MFTRRFIARTGATLKLPMDQGEGQHWNRKPGNLYSEPVKIHFDPAAGAAVRIELTKTIPPVEAAAGYQVRQARAYSEQVADGVLGAADVCGRDRIIARWI